MVVMACGRLDEEQQDVRMNMDTGPKTMMRRGHEYGQGLDDNEKTRA